MLKKICKEVIKRNFLGKIKKKIMEINNQLVVFSMTPG